MNAASGSQFCGGYTCVVANSSNMEIINCFKPLKRFIVAVDQTPSWVQAGDILVCLKEMLL